MNGNNMQQPVNNNGGKKKSGAKKMIVLVLIIIALLAAAFAGGMFMMNKLSSSDSEKETATSSEKKDKKKDKSEEEEEDEEETVEVETNDKGQNIITIMTAAYAVESASDDATKNPIMKEVEEKLGTDIVIKFTPSANYGEKVTATMAAGTYPDIMRVPDRTSAIIKNCRAGTFWDITDKIKEKNKDGSYKYPNLAKANDEVLHNMSVDGRIYGLYSSRALGRNGASIRKDWLANIGYDHYPETMEEFYDVCKKFTENDPDGNGQKDTYGLVLSSYTSPIEQITIWNGAPNKYGIENGKVKPAFMYDEYFEALTMLRDMVNKGYINANWATMDPGKWNEPMLNGRGGIIIDVVDRARRVQNNFLQQDPPKEDVVGVFGAVAPSADEDKRVLPTTGYNGFFVFPKASVKSEEELELCLKLMNDLEDPEISDLLQKGIEGRHYIINAYGEYEKMKTADGSDDTSNDNEFADLIQIMTFINGESNITVPYVTRTAEEVDEVQKANENYTVPDPTAPYISETATFQGTSLDAIISEANTKYINGVIDEAGWKAAVEAWKEQGGDKIIEELSAEYAKDTSEFKVK